MTDTARNELVEKMSSFFYMKLPDPKDSRTTGEVAADSVISRIESLGYEIVKKEHLKELTDAFVLQQVRAGNVTFRAFTKEEIFAQYRKDFGPK